MQLAEEKIEGLFHTAPFLCYRNSSQSELFYNIKKALRANDAQLADKKCLLRK